MSGSWTRFALAGAATLVWGLASGDALAFGSMRCGSDLVSEGDTLYEVRATCGEPDQLDAYVEYRRVIRWVRQCTRDTDGKTNCSDVAVEHQIPVQMHRATYDFGRNRFIQYVTFEEGRLKSVQSGSYGKKERAGG
jgi:hypothetical protein